MLFYSNQSCDLDNSFSTSFQYNSIAFVPPNPRVEIGHILNEAQYYGRKKKVEQEFVVPQSDFYLSKVNAISSISFHTPTVVSKLKNKMQRLAQKELVHDSDRQV